MVANFTLLISPKVNEIARLEFELAYYDVAVQHVSYNAIWTPPPPPPPLSLSLYIYVCVCASLLKVYEKIYACPLHRLITRILMVIFFFPVSLVVSQFQYVQPFATRNYVIKDVGTSQGTGSGQMPLPYVSQWNLTPLQIFLRVYFKWVREKRKEGEQGEDEVGVLRQGRASRDGESRCCYIYQRLSFYDI